MHWTMKYNSIFETGTPCGPSFGTQLKLVWMKQASPEKRWATSMWRGKILFPPVTSSILSKFVLKLFFFCLLDWANMSIQLQRFFLDGCRGWRRTSRRLMSTTDPWTVTETSTGGSALGLTICLRSSCVSSPGKWVRARIRNKAYFFS